MPNSNPPRATTSHALSATTTPLIARNTDEVTTVLPSTPPFPPPAFVMTPSLLALTPTISNQLHTQVYAPSFTYRHTLNMHMVLGPQAPQVGPSAQELACPRCLQNVRTVVEYEPTHSLLCLGSCVLLCICWPCVCVPYCMDSCQNANHYCPNCNAYIGSYSN